MEATNSMPRPTKSLNPVDRLGVYKHLDDIPKRYRLHHHANAYDGSDTWQEFCDKYEYQQASHERYEEEVDRVGDHWRAFMREQSQHHALATPADVEAWCTELLSELSLRRAYDYWLRVNRFYQWLQWHADHPHVYNPVMMAAADGDSTGEIWAWKAEQTRERREEYRGETDE